MSLLPPSSLTLTALQLRQSVQRFLHSSSKRIGEGEYECAISLLNELCVYVKSPENVTALRGDDGEEERGDDDEVETPQDKKVGSTPDEMPSQPNVSIASNVAADHWISQNVALEEFAKEYAWMRLFFVELAQHTLSTSNLGLRLRVFGGALLSTIDLITDIYKVGLGYLANPKEQGPQFLRVYSG
ncbi:hypothetical protein TrLO_g7505 [Triparma laevis f. longispina]|uniref:Uncharacterized protein n=1 Tax=Triparma laevis f. longispina TaxID=1714387 RepID=A0A9W7ECA8_9STRA|nr:hypothetical protein TrLO_g7505 [Triparma laevis f. longispina]